MPYVHLANGDVLTVNAKELAELTNDAAPGTIHQNGTQSQIIGVYADDVELIQTDDEKAAATDREEFENWKAEQKTSKKDS